MMWYLRFIKSIVNILCGIILKTQYILHKFFPKHIPIYTCRGCFLPQEELEKCPYKPKKGNLICYYYTKKLRILDKKLRKVTHFSKKRNRT